MEKVVKITKENLELINDILIDMDLAEVNLLDSNKYLNLASKVEDDQEVKITEIEVRVILDCIYNYIEFHKIRDIDLYLNMIIEILEMVK